MSQPKIPVLFLLMEFAPVNTTGNYRGLKFVKYLSEMNIQPIIITFVEEEGAKYFNSKIDNKLLNDIPDDAIVYRIHCDDKKPFIIPKVKEFLSIYFSIKDSLAKRWESNLFQEIGSIINRHKPLILFSSIPPFSAGLLATRISNDYSLPLIIDMRDLWALFGNPLPSWLHYYLTIKEESKIFEHAKKIICVTPQMISMISKVHPEIPISKFKVITNGFDGDERWLKPFYFDGSKEKVVIGYIGSFYYEPDNRNNVFQKWWKKRGLRKLEYIPVELDWLYRSPYFFFKALHQLFKDHPKLKEIIKIEFVGKLPGWLKVMLEEFSLTEIFHSHGFVSQEEILKIQENFDILLATSEKILNKEHYCLPSKIFDYVGLGKPILGFVTSGIQHEFLSNCGLSIICNPDETAESSNTIFKLLKDGAMFQPNVEYLNQFTRLNLAKDLLEVFREVIANNEKNTTKRLIDVKYNTVES